jgi:hypothetical protein
MYTASKITSYSSEFRACDIRLDCSNHLGMPLSWRQDGESTPSRAGAVVTGKRMQWPRKVTLQFWQGLEGRVK